jgi:CIC family chloride channel protein
MMPPVSVRESDDLHAALEAILKHGMREVPVTNDAGQIVGFVDEAEINAAYHAAVDRVS